MKGSASSCSSYITVGPNFCEIGITESHQLQLQVIHRHFPFASRVLSIYKLPLNEKGANGIKENDDNIFGLSQNAFHSK